MLQSTMMSPEKTLGAGASSLSEACLCSMRPSRTQCVMLVIPQDDTAEGACREVSKLLLSSELGTPEAAWRLWCIT